MPIKIKETTEEKIIRTPLPTHGGKYAVIPHGVIITKVQEELHKAGFEINKAYYKSTITGDIAKGVYHLNYHTDPDMSLMFAWSNSYDKTQKFKCSVGSYVIVCDNNMIQGDLGNAVRKHMGTAKDDAFLFIESQISHAAEHYENLVQYKNHLKKITLSRATQAGIVGRLYVDDELLTLTQVGVVKREMEKQTTIYDSNPNSCWSFYNHLTCALKDSHPTTWLTDHAKLTAFFVNEYGLLVNTSNTETSNVIEVPVVIEEVNPITNVEHYLAPEATESSMNHGVVFL